MPLKHTPAPWIHDYSEIIDGRGSRVCRFADYGAPWPEDMSVILAAPDMLRLLRVMFPYMLLVCVAAAFMGMLNARGHFFIPALGAATLNVVMIASVLWLAPNLGLSFPKEERLPPSRQEGPEGRTGLFSSERPPPIQGAGHPAGMLLVGQHAAARVKNPGVGDV